MLLHFERRHLQTQSAPKSFLIVKLSGVCRKYRFLGARCDLPSRLVRKGGLGICSWKKSQSHSNQENQPCPAAPSSPRFPSLAFSAGFLFSGGLSAPRGFRAPPTESQLLPHFRPSVSAPRPTWGKSGYMAGHVTPSKTGFF